MFLDKPSINFSIKQVALFFVKLFCIEIVSSSNLHIFIRSKNIRVAVTTLVSDRCPPILHMFRNYKSPRTRIQQILETRQSGLKSSVYQRTNRRNSGLTHRQSTSALELDRETQSTKSSTLSTSQSILNFFSNAQGLLIGSETSTNLSTSDTELNNPFEQMPEDNEHVSLSIS